MTDSGRPGVFWLSSSADRSRRGQLHNDGDRWVLQVDGALFDLEWGPKVCEVGALTMKTYGVRPAEDVRDSAPRVIHGELDDGGPVSFLDAQLDGTTGDIFGRVEGTQRFAGWRVLFGALVADLNAPAQGARWTLAVSRDAMGGSGTTPCRGGTLSHWESAGDRGFSLVLDSPQSIRTLTDLTPKRISNLFAVACGWDTRMLHRQVLLPDGRWCVFGGDANPPAGPRDTDFVDPTHLDLEVLARWTDASSELGPLPYVLASTSIPLQQEAQMLAAALEGYHRRLDKTKPFSGLSKAALKRSVKAAVDAGVAKLNDEGWSHLEFARSKFTDALGYVGQMSFAERLDVILEPVQGVAPGLLGPDRGQWIRAMKRVRNVQSHQLQDHDDFGEEEISQYLVLALSARWALRIAMLLPLLPAAAITEGLRRSSRFSYTLATVDNERVWEDYSCLGAFSEEGVTHPKGSNPSTDAEHQPGQD